MAADLAVALLHGDRLAAPLAGRLGVEVAATTPDDHLDVAAELGTRAALVVGLCVRPWPVEPDLHARGSAELDGYTGVVSWHALASLHEALAEVAAPGVRAGAHLLVTAPDPGPDTPPEDVMFLREVAQALEARLAPGSRSIAWRGSTRTPTAVDALRTTVEAHGVRDVVECPVGPGMGADPDLLAVGDELGLRLTCVDLGQGTLLDLLTEVVGTVAEHEGAA
jgi:hypothetical protein